ncbi:hypothetical protein IQ268_14320 [Oculatella sp. LEGE 06141]|uniref:hypothetical protein n=1 Tax=Oculatella sp. LEGE 06141 TaxID=1828648 RepID=UPI00187E47C5|nr:hypothetical protein [Oculatella sp. LEGE 06141]MBE9179741.1 hypothetical protein [Oculatella sp. LEGE 06141]
MAVQRSTDWQTSQHISQPGFDCAQPSVGWLSVGRLSVGRLSVGQVQSKSTGMGIRELGFPTGSLCF